jgi:hypothetical protein
MTTLSVSTSSARVALPAGSALYLRNDGAVAAAFRLGSSSVVALTTDPPLGPGDVLQMSAGGNTHLAGITLSGSSTLSVTAVPQPEIIGIGSTGPTGAAGSTGAGATGPTGPVLATWTGPTGPGATGSGVIYSNAGVLTVS